MCGIAGLFTKDSIRKEEILSMTEALVHRGPDAQNCFINDSNTLALGHTRLSIIDLSSEANQPMRSADGRFVIVFNGEIYNFKSIKTELLKANSSLKFVTQSDTEIILLGYAAWGSSLCARLEGMFSIAIFDNKLRQLFLCRDRAGKKPLYYYHDNNYFAFASELKSLMKNHVVRANAAIDKKVIGTFLHLGYVPEPLTIYSTIKKFPSGHFSIVTDTLSIRSEVYWELENNVRREKKWDERAALTALKSGLEKAVEKRMVSDVPLGAFLSGGTDSSIVVALASQFTKHKLKTFSISFKASKFDESHYAKEVANCLKTEHYAYVLEEQEGVDLLEDYLKHFDEPFADTSAIPTMLVSKLARKEVKVALTGDGGDEVFLGYGSYDWAMRLQNPLVQLLRAPLHVALRNLSSDKFRKASRMLEKVNAADKQSHIFSQDQSLFSKAELLTRLLTHSTEKFYHTGYTPLLRNMNAAETQALFDIHYYLKDELLVKVDRASMYYGLECRCPLLDHQIIELAVSFPYHFKRKGGERKWILKELLKEYLPEHLVHRPKWGFSIPLAQWMRGQLSYLLDKYLNREIVELLNVVKFDYVNKLRTCFENGHDFYYNRLWVLIVIHKWLLENDTREN